MANGFQVIGFQSSGFQSRDGAIVIDFHAERDPRFQEISKRYVYDAPYAYIAIYTPIEVPEPEFPERPETDFEFTKPVIPTPMYISPEKRATKF